MKLKEIRLSRGLSQSQLAKLSDVKIGMIQKYEQGYKDINKAQVITVYKLSKALECRIEDLIETE